MSLFTITVPAPERAVEYVDGACTRVLGPGRHRRPSRARYESVTVLERLTTTAPQEVLTSDGVAVKVTAALRWRVSDPRAYLEGALDPASTLQLAVQLALRDALVDVAADDVVRTARRELGAALAEAARGAADALGIEVLDVVVKDVVLPADLRAAYAEQVTARARGAAQLEAARAETAALRSLANAARMLDESPALARLRLVQALPHGSTVELTSGD
ncbi:SPFH domain-containing protein [Nocardioides sp. SYSU D00038]|uniref:SPFH domain-containing protein n=1 Tax=Nocardioides sp. SYSU D00038 TaxID=2812554 RepID=UPI001966E8E2|nr:SPFH domain-containing protein [Nocardioides sp. SYSU D00038]